jgi:hypothetical protein
MSDTAIAIAIWAFVLFEFVAAVLIIRRDLRRQRQRRRERRDTIPHRDLRAEHLRR